MLEFFLKINLPLDLNFEIKLYSFFSGSELLFQDASGGLSVVDVAKNTSRVHMSNQTFVSSNICVIAIFFHF